MIQPNSADQPGPGLYELAKKLFPICRSITGNGVRQTLDVLQGELAKPLTIHEVPTGTQAFDWQVPNEWNIKQAWIKNSRGETIVDFAWNNLHVVGYSIPVDKWVSKAELDEHLYSLENQADAIPYVTSYYKERWGFCLSHEQRQTLEDGDYHVFIDSELKPGSLTYAECVLPGESEEEVLLSSYICHPSMANNELSGPLVSLAVFNWLAMQKYRRYTYRLVWVPESIGAIVYLSRNVNALKEKVKAGFVITCIGDEGGYSTLSSRYGNTLADKVAQTVLHEYFPEQSTVHSFLKRGSDERQYCAPGIDLPVCALMRTKYGEYPQYHTSLDDLDFVSAKGLQGGFEFVQHCVQLLESNEYYQVKCLAEPKLSKYDLYPTVSKKGSSRPVRDMLNFIAYCDGDNDLIDIAKIIGIPVKEALEIAHVLSKKGLIKANLPIEPESTSHYSEVR